METETKQIPRHIAIILDGNGRWAAEHGKKRAQGHLAGAENVETISDALIERGVKYLTLYAFSTENWKRSEEEVGYLMSLLKQYLIKNKKDALRKDVRIRVIGDRSMLSEELRDLIADVEEATAKCATLTMCFAISYGGRNELKRAVCRLAEKVQAGELKPDQIEESTIESFLDTAGIPDPDLMIRTSGEERISNFLLWQLAYSEFYFTPVYWPDFSVEELDKAIEAYQRRNRRFGGR